MSITELISAIRESVTWLFEPIFADEPSHELSHEPSHASSSPPSHPNFTRVSYLHNHDGQTYVWRFNRETYQLAIQEINTHADLGLISWDQAYELCSQIIEMELATTATTPEAARADARKPQGM